MLLYPHFLTRYGLRLLLLCSGVQLASNAGTIIEGFSGPVPGVGLSCRAYVYIAFYNVVKYRIIQRLSLCYR